LDVASFKPAIMPPAWRRSIHASFIRIGLARSSITIAFVPGRFRPGCRVD